MGNSTRISPVDDVDSLGKDARSVLAESEHAMRSAPNTVMTLLRAPARARTFLQYAATFRSSALPVRLRELAILRVSWRCRSEYEWSHHVDLALARGVTEDEVARVPLGSHGKGWTSLEAAVFDAVDELHDESIVSDVTWAVLAEHLDESQLIELPILVGHYNAVAWVLNTLGVPSEPGFVGLPST